MANIDELFEALLNGETTDIKPQSRIEAYLKALVEKNGLVPTITLEYRNGELAFTDEGREVAKKVLDSFKNGIYVNSFVCYPSSETANDKTVAFFCGAYDGEENGEIVTVIIYGASTDSTGKVITIAYVNDELVLVVE